MKIGQFCPQSQYCGQFWQKMQDYKGKTTKTVNNSETQTILANIKVKRIPFQLNYFGFVFMLLEPTSEITEVDQSATEDKPKEKRRIRRKVMKSKTSMNDEGYMGKCNFQIYQLL